MCHEEWFRRREREERLEEELRLLLDDQQREPESPTPIAERDPEDADDERVPDDSPVVRS
jgi:hypothetical protein